MIYIIFIHDKKTYADDKLYMNEIKNALSKLKFTNIKTIGNDGTVFVDSPLPVQCKWLTSELTRLLNTQVQLVLKPIDELVNTIKSAPEWWSADVTWRHNIVFLLDGSVHDLISQMKIDDEAEKLFIDGDTILWSSAFADRELYESSNYSKLKEHPNHSQLVIRNSITLEKILELAERFAKK